MSPHYFMNKHEGESEESFVERLGEDLENHIVNLENIIFSLNYYFY